jgi:hypothetical protein
MTIWRSVDDGESYEIAALIDPGPSGYSSLQIARGGGVSGGGATGGGPGDADEDGYWEESSGAQSTSPSLANQSTVPVHATNGNTGESVWILYEQSDVSPHTLSSLSAEALIGGLSVLNPDRFVLRKVDL